MKTLDFTEKQNISYCISNELRDEQIKINIKKVSARLSPDPELKKDPIAIVCFGHSLKETWEKLKDFKFIMTCSGAHKFLIEKGITPTWHVDLEPREHKIKMLGTPSVATQYLIASTIHPRYLDQLEGYDLKLWHIFANDAEAARILPKGEWKITGGSSVGLRCMSLARILGFTDLHIFGMDGNMKGLDGSHATDHPNAPKDCYETIYEGKTYLTTPSILFCAKETFKELDQMPDVHATFYGDGLVQDMAKTYKKKKVNGQVDIAYKEPELISKEHRELNEKMHMDYPTFGMGGSKYRDHVLKLSQDLKTTSILDYGCGKGQLAKSLPFPIWEYDPAVPEKSALPKAADIVICTDVLEHIERDKINFVLSDLRRCVLKVGYFVISTRMAVKSYANGQNAHLIVKDKDWWQLKIKKYFHIENIVQNPDELHVFVSPKKSESEVHAGMIAEVERNGKKIKFLVPNDITAWRAKTLFTKEPATIAWLESMKKDEVFFDVGANIGSYSVYAGVLGLKVYAFEPGADNYGLLLKNLVLNNIEPHAYCVALTDEPKVSMLYMGDPNVGGACNTFSEEVGHDLQKRKTKTTQGCIGMTLDSFIERGLPAPHHLKIDVDGFEHKVIRGADHILRNGLKSLLVEINPSLPDHLAVVEHLKVMGFEYDEEQVKAAARKSGPFEGCAEYIFKKREVKPLVKSLVNNVTETPFIADQKFNALYLTDVFTENIYKKILESIPEEYTPIEKSRGTKGYPLRFTANMEGEVLSRIEQEMRSGGLKAALLHKFGLKDEGYDEDIVLIRDLPGYFIPPHTDSPNKIISALFYLPDNDHYPDEGTSIFEPIEEGVKCESGVHHSFDSFKKVYTAPFVRNSAFIFARTNNSFHGVTPSRHIRNVLLYNIKKSKNVTHN